MYISAMVDWEIILECGHFIPPNAVQLAPYGGQGFDPFNLGKGQPGRPRL